MRLPYQNFYHISQFMANRWFSAPQILFLFPKNPSAIFTGLYFENLQIRHYLPTIMKEPEKPLPTDCCGTGCARCVYDIYLEHLEKYKKWKSQQEKQQD